MTKLLIADDHELVRKGLEIIVSREFGPECRIEFAKDGKEVTEKLKNSAYDMLITDLNMPNTDGLSLISNALSIRAELKILIVTVNPDNIFASRYLQAGAYGFINKNEPNSVIVDALWTIYKGKRYLTIKQTELFMHTFLHGSSSNPFDSLSKREFEVTILLLKGLGAIEVANVLSINTSTASSYRGRVFAKLGIKNILELNRLANQFHLLANF